MRLEPWLYRLPLRLRSLFRRERVEQELEEEIRFHLDRQREQFIAEGAAEADAARAARRRFQGIERSKDECRDARRVRFFENLLSDLRLACRSLRKSPGFTAVAILTLALGIGANSTLFTLLDPILFRALPYPNSERLVRVFRTSPQSQSWPHSVPNFIDYRAQNQVFSETAAFTWTSFNFADGGQASERVEGLAVSSDFFPALGVAAERGRVFTDAEDNAGVDPLLVISNRFWRGRFGSDPSVIGRPLRLNGRDAKIIGIMPDSFENPLFFGRVDVWAPLAFTDNQRQNRGNNFLNMVARLKPGVSLAQADSHFAGLAERLRNEHGESDRREGIRLQGFKQSMQQATTGPVSWFTFGMTAFVLLIACANLANLQLARTTRRTREFALRAALGGGRRRLLEQSLTESVLLSLLGCAVALPGSIIAARLIAVRAFSGLPGVQLAVDLRFFTFSFLCALLAGLIFGAVPAWLASRANLSDVIKDAPRNASGSRSQHRLRHGLIVAEVAFALVLLAGTAVFIKGLRNVTDMNPGWRTDNLLIGRIGLDNPKYTPLPQRLEFYSRLQEALASLPGVQNAAISLSAPTWFFDSSSNMTIEGPKEAVILANNETVSPQYFDTLGIPLREGRAFTADDRIDHQTVLIINESLAKAYWPNESPLGKRMAFTGAPQPRWFNIVGVVADVRFPSALMPVDTMFTIYRPLGQSPIRGARVELRTGGSPESLIPAVRDVAARLDKDQPIFGLRSAKDQIRENIAGLDTAGALLSAFSMLGLALAGVGIFGVISYSVTQRTGEIGIRMALGAESRIVRWMVLKQGLTISSLGAVIGLAAAAGTTRILSTAIPGLPVGGRVTLLIMTGVLLAVASIACYLPARQASKVDPIIALRQD